MISTVIAPQGLMLLHEVEMFAEKKFMFREIDWQLLLWNFLCYLTALIDS